MRGCFLRLLSLPVSVWGTTGKAKQFTGRSSRVRGKREAGKWGREWKSGGGDSGYSVMKKYQVRSWRSFAFWCLSSIL